MSGSPGFVQIDGEGTRGIRPGDPVSMPHGTGREAVRLPQAAIGHPLPGSTECGGSPRVPHGRAEAA